MAKKRGKQKQKQKRRGRRGRFVRGEDALDQFVSITKAQSARRTKRTRQIIDSIRKSERRLENELDRIRDLDDANEQFGQQPAP